jgi:hypothetical protein
MSTNPTNPARHEGELDRLIKLMRLTTSPHDHEALAAMRLANGWLRRNNTDWEGVLRGKVTIVEDPFAGLAQPAAPTQSAAPRPVPRPPVRPTNPSWVTQPAPPLRTWNVKPKRTTLADLGLD